VGTTILQCEAAACWLVLLAHGRITSAIGNAVKRLRALMVRLLPIGGSSTSGRLEAQCCRSAQKMGV